MIRLFWNTLRDSWTSVDSNEFVLIKFKFNCLDMVILAHIFGYNGMEPDGVFCHN